MRFPGVNIDGVVSQISNFPFINVYDEVCLRGINTDEPVKILFLTTESAEVTEKSFLLQAVTSVVNL